MEQGCIELILKNLNLCMIKSMCFEITIDYELLQINFNEIIYSHTFTVIFSANLVYKVFEIRVAILKTWQLKSSSFN